MKMGGYLRDNRVEISTERREEEER